MPVGEAPGPGSAPGRVVVIAVEPALLAGALARVLDSRGWQVRRAGPGPTQPVPADAVVVSPALAGQAWGLNVPLTIVLSDPPDRPYASVHRLPGDEFEGLEGLLTALGENQ